MMVKFHHIKCEKNPFLYQSEILLGQVLTKSLAQVPEVTWSSNFLDCLMDLQDLKYCICNQTSNATQFFAVALKSQHGVPGQTTK